MEGSIIKGVGGFYYVSTDQGVITCKAKGAFRREGIAPVVGDRVSIVAHESGYAHIEEILPRRNLLIRPAVANIDRLLIVLSAHLPRAGLAVVRQAHRAGRDEPYRTDNRSKQGG